MPELPEVETVVRDLRPLLVGKKFTAVRSGPRQLRTKWSKAWEPRLIGSQVAAIRRRGKWILIDLTTAQSDLNSDIRNPRSALLVLHLGMTGQLTVKPVASPLEKHTHLVFRLDDGNMEFRFRDIRRFGSAALFADEMEWEVSLGTPLGPEPFDLAPAAWRQSLRKTERPLKSVLLDQGVVAGVGNIYADESLYMARIHPRRRGRETSPQQAERLRQSLVTVLSRAIAGRGSTIRDYVGGSGLMGEYQDTLAVYGRAGEPCLKCRTPVESIRLGGRSTHYCPRCQK